MDTLGIPLELLWTSVGDALSVGISVHSASGEIEWVNRKLCEIYSRPFSEFIGLGCREIFHGENSPCPHEQVFDPKFNPQLRSEVSISERILSLTVAPICDETGRGLAFVRMLNDVTDQRRVQQQLIKAERFATIGQVLSAVAHDIGTPLNVISGYSEYLLMRNSAEGQGQKEISSILQQTRRIAAMIGDTLDLARPSSGRKDPVDLKALAAGALELAGQPLGKINVKVSLTCRMDTPLIYGEAPQFRQVLFNLLLNAGHSVGVGGNLELVIEEAADQPGLLVLRLCGKDVAGVSHDFSKSLGFLSAREIDDAPMAIGLSLVREILNDAGAKIVFDNVCGRGIPLTVYIPVNANNRGSQS